MLYFGGPISTIKLPCLNAEADTLCLPKNIIIICICIHYNTSLRRLTTFVTCRILRLQPHYLSNYTQKINKYKKFVIFIVTLSLLRYTLGFLIITSDKVAFIHCHFIVTFVTFQQYNEMSIIFTLSPLSPHCHRLCHHLSYWFYGIYTPW